MKSALFAMACGLAVIMVPACADDSSAEPVAIIPIGDSLTERVGANTYRCHLDAMLTEADVEFDFVGSRTQPASAYTCSTEFDRDHEAFSGASITQLGDAAIESVGSLQPAVALVLLGGNDLERQSPADVADELASFVGDLQAARPDLTVLVAQYPACLPTPGCEINMAFNDEIADFARLTTDESTVLVVDMYTDFSLDNLHDAYHPNDAGDEEMARRWMSALTDSGAIDVTTESA